MNRESRDHGNIGHANTGRRETKQKHKIDTTQKNTDPS
jgi:hypothetical protein